MLQDAGLLSRQQDLVQVLLFDEKYVGPSTGPPFGAASLSSRREGPRRGLVPSPASLP